MSYMFLTAKNFNKYLGNWDTSNVILMYNMFTGSGCSIKNCLQ